MKNIFIKLLFFIFFSSTSYACALLQVPIGSTVNSAQNTFDFLSGHNSTVYGEYVTARYNVFAIDYCEGSGLENADLEVLVHENKVVGINLVSSTSEIKNEIYQFVKNRIADPGEKVKNDDWSGSKDLSIGSLKMFYSKVNLRGQTLEIFEMTNSEMMKFTTFEEVQDVNG